MFDKLLTVLSKNLGCTIVLLVTAVLFVYFSNGVIEGLIAAVAAVIAFTCAAILYKEYKALPNKKAAPTKKAAPAKKTTAKRK